MSRGNGRGQVARGGMTGRVRPRSDSHKADGIVMPGRSCSAQKQNDKAIMSPNNIPAVYTAHHYHVRRAINAALNDAEFIKAKTNFFNFIFDGTISPKAADIHADEVLGQLCTACDNVMFALPVSDPVNMEQLTTDVSRVMADKLREKAKVGGRDVSDDTLRCLEDAVNKFTSIFIVRTQPVIEKKTPPKDFQVTTRDGENPSILKVNRTEPVTKHSGGVLQHTSGGLLGSPPLLQSPASGMGISNGDGFHTLPPKGTVNQPYNLSSSSTFWSSSPSLSVSNQQHQNPVLASHQQCVTGGLMPTPAILELPPQSADLQQPHIAVNNIFHNHSPPHPIILPQQTHQQPLHSFFKTTPVAPDIETRYITISPVEPGIDREALKNILVKICNLTRANAPPGTIISVEKPVCFLNYDVFSKAQLIDMEEQLKEVECNEECTPRTSTELKVIEEKKKAAANVFFAAVSFDSSASASEAHRRINSMSEASGEQVKSAPMQLAELVLLWGDNRSKIEHFQMCFLEQLSQFDKRQPKSLFQQLDIISEEIEACNVATERKESNESVLNAMKKKCKLLDTVEEIMTKLRALNIDPKTPPSQRAQVIPEEKYSSSSQLRPNGNDVRVLYLTGLTEKMSDKKVMFMFEDLLKVQPTKIWRIGNDLQVEFQSVGAVLKLLRTLDCMEFEFGGIRFSREMPSTPQITE